MSSDQDVGPPRGLPPRGAGGEDPVRVAADLHLRGLGHPPRGPSNGSP